MEGTVNMCGTGVNMNNAVINLDHGDPTMFESYWRKLSDMATITFNGFQSLSYFSDNKSLCWFLEPELEEEIKRLHKVVGNAVVDDHYIVVGTGSSQLILAALYAVSPSDQPGPVSVVSAAPYYSSYPAMADLLRSELFKWGGDARTFQQDGRPYIELITSPNNPDGFIRQPAVAVNAAHRQGFLIHDLAYYWPHYTPITSPADHDVMLFTASKCTGHAGSRIGWAIVRDKEVAKKMVKFMEIFTIGVSKEAQLRAARILGVVSESCSFNAEIDNFFEHSRRRMSQRWEALRRVVDAGNVFSLPEYPIHYCNFTKDLTQTLPAFAWMMMKGREEDCEKVLRDKKILTRSGIRFGVDPKCVRISMVSKDDEFTIFLQRLMALQQETANGNN